MSALVLLVATVVPIVWAWSRWVQRISRGAAIALLLLPMCITGRALFTGRIYAPIDLPLMAEPFRTFARQFGVTSAHNNVLSDVYTQMIPWQEAVRDSWAHGVWPLFNPFILCGDILAAASQPAPYDPFNLLSLLIPLAPALTYSASITFFIAAFSMFAFARAIGCREEAALAGAAAWMFSGMVAFFVEWPLARAWAWLPLLLFAVRSVVRVRSAKSGALLTMTLVLLILTGHPEMLFHEVVIGALYGIFEMAGVRRDAVRTIAVACASGVLALLLTAFALMPFLEAVPQTHDYAIRTGIYAHTLFPPMPEIVRRRVAASFLPFWGGQPWRGAITPDFDANTWPVGAVALALALSAMIWAPRRREIWFFLPLAVVCAWAGANALPVARWLHALPLFDVTLNERLAFGAAFALSLLAAIGADAWPEAKGRFSGALLIAGVALALLLATVAAAPQQVRNGVPPELIRSVMIAEIAPLAALLLMLVMRTPARLAMPVVCALILVQRVAVAGGIYPVLPRRSFYPEVPILRAVPKETGEPFRVAALSYTFIPNGATMYRMEDPRGYEAMTFQRLVDTYPLWSTPQPAWFNVIGDLGRPFLSFLNVRYAIVLPHAATPPWRVVFSDASGALLENPDALPRAFVPRHIRYERGGEATLTAMERAVEFGTQAWIEVPENPPGDTDNGPGLLKVARTPNGLDLEATMERDGWAVISQTAWKGWRAYIDGRRVQWHFANHAFLGVFIPAGRHHVRLVFLPESFTRGRTISLAALAAITVAWIIRRRAAPGASALP